MSGPSSRPSASPPSWLRGVKAAGSPANMMAALAADIRSEVRSTNRDRRDASEAAFTRLQRDAKRDALTRSSARSSHASEAQSSAASPQRSSTLYHELLYAEGMLGLAERARWVEEAKGVLTAQEMAVDGLRSSDWAVTVRTADLSGCLVDCAQPICLVVWFV